MGLQAFTDLQAHVMIQHQTAATAHYMKAYPDSEMRARLLTQLAEPITRPPTRAAVPKSAIIRPASKTMPVAAPAGISNGVGSGQAAHAATKVKVVEAVPASKLEFASKAQPAASPFGAAEAQGTGKGEGSKGSVLTVARPMKPPAQVEAGPSKPNVAAKEFVPKGLSLSGGQGSFNIAAQEFVPSQGSATSQPSLTASQELTLNQDQAGVLNSRLASDAFDARSNAVDDESNVDGEVAGADKDGQGSQTSGKHATMNPAHRGAGALMMSLFPPRNALSAAVKPADSTAAAAISAVRQLQQAMGKDSTASRTAAAPPAPTMFNFTVPIARSFATVNNKFTSTEVIGCDASSAATYKATKDFGIVTTALTDAERTATTPTALVLYQVDSHQLHGLWEAQPGIREQPGGSKVRLISTSTHLYCGLGFTSGL